MISTLELQICATTFLVMSVWTPYAKYHLLNFPNKIENETLFSRVVHLSYILSPISILRYTLQRRGHEHRVPYSMIMAIIEI